MDVSSDARGSRERSTARAIDAPRDGGKGRNRSFGALANLTSALVPWYSLDSCRIVASLESCAACCMESTPCGSILATSSMLATWSRALRSCGDTSRPDRKGSRWKSFTTLHFHRRLLRGEGVGRGRAARGSGGRHGGELMDRSLAGGSRVGALSCPSARLATPAAADRAVPAPTFARLLQRLPETPV